MLTPRSLLALLLSLTPLLGAACDDATAPVAPDAATAADAAAADASDSAALADTGAADVSASSDAVTPDAAASDASPADATADAASTDAPAPADGPLVGRWAQLQVQSALTEVPFVGETTATTTTHLVLDVAMAPGGGYAVTQTVCDVALDSGTELVRTVLPDAAVAAIPPATRGASLSPTNAVSVSYLAEVWGAVLGDLNSDALPTSPTDPRVVDHEADGKPGMTVRVAGLLDGEVYVVQRGATTLEGLYDGADRFDGLVTWSQEQSILGADNPLLESPLETRVDPDANASYFRTTRVPGGTDCAAILAQSTSLFAR